MLRLTGGRNSSRPGRAGPGLSGRVIARSLACLAALGIACGSGGSDAGVPPGTITGRDTAITPARPLEPDPVPGSVRLFLTAPGVGFEDLPPGLPYSRVSRTSPDSGFVGNEGGASGPWYGIAYYSAQGTSGAMDVYATHGAVTSNMTRIVSSSFGGRISEGFDIPDGGRLQAYRTGFTGSDSGGDSFEGSMIAFEANGFVVVAFAVALHADAPGALDRLDALVGSTRICSPGQASSADHVY